MQRVGSRLWILAVLAMVETAVLLSSASAEDVQMGELSWELGAQSDSPSEARASIVHTRFEPSRFDSSDGILLTNNEQPLKAATVYIDGYGPNGTDFTWRVLSANIVGDIPSVTVQTGTLAALMAREGRALNLVRVTLVTLDRSDQETTVASWLQAPRPPQIYDLSYRDGIFHASSRVADDVVLFRDAQGTQLVGTVSAGADGRISYPSNDDLYATAVNFAGVPSEVVQLSTVAIANAPTRTEHMPQVVLPSPTAEPTVPSTRQSDGKNAGAATRIEPDESASDDPMMGLPGGTKDSEPKTGTPVAPPEGTTTGRGTGGGPAVAGNGGTAESDQTTFSYNLYFRFPEVYMEMANWHPNVLPYPERVKTRTWTPTWVIVILPVVHDTMEWHDPIAFSLDANPDTEKDWQAPDKFVRMTFPTLHEHTRVSEELLARKGKPALYGGTRRPPKQAVPPQGVRYDFYLLDAGLVMVRDHDEETDEHPSDDVLAVLVEEITSLAGQEVAKAAAGAHGSGAAAVVGKVGGKIIGKWAGKKLKKYLQRSDEPKVLYAQFAHGLGEEIPFRDVVPDKATDDVEWVTRREDAQGLGAKHMRSRVGSADNRRWLPYPFRFGSLFKPGGLLARWEMQYLLDSELYMFMQENEGSKVSTRRGRTHAGPVAIPGGYRSELPGPGTLKTRLLSHPSDTIDGGVQTRPLVSRLAKSVLPEVRQKPVASSRTKKAIPNTLRILQLGRPKGKGPLLVTRKTTGSPSSAPAAVKKSLRTTSPVPDPTKGRKQLKPSTNGRQPR